MVLIRSVLNSTPMYRMTVNTFPVGVRGKLRGLSSHFLWGESVDKKRIHL